MKLFVSVQHPSQAIYNTFDIHLHENNTDEWGIVLIISVQRGIWVWRHTDVVHIILADLSVCLFHILPHALSENKNR